MKKLFITLFALVLLLPFTTYADMSPISIETYAVQATKGSEVVIEIRGFQDMDGTLKYNKDELEYISTRVEDPTAIEGEVFTGAVKLTKNTPGELKFKYQPLVVGGRYTEGTLGSIKVKFEVLKVPNSKTIKVTYYPDNTEVTYGTESIDIEIPLRLPEDGVKTDNDTFLGEWYNNPKPYEDNEDDESTEPQTTDTENEGDKGCEPTECVCEEPPKQDNTLLYISWAVSGLLLVVLIVVILKNKKEKNKEETKKE